MTVFLVVGVVGLVVLLVALMAGDSLDALLPDIDLGDGLFSLPVLAGFVAAFGFAGMAVHSLSDGSTGASVAGGAAAGVVVGWLTLRLTRGLMHMRTDETPTSRDLVGRPGRVVTAVRPGQLGEILLTHAGQSVKLAARSERPLERGDEVVVVDVLSSTAVTVVAASEFWGSPDQKGTLPQ